MLGRVGQVTGKVPGGGGEFHLIVLHHTDCGITRLAGDPAMLAHYFQIRKRTQGKSSHRSSRGGRRRCCLAPGDSGITRRVACLRPRL